MAGNWLGNYKFDVVRDKFDVIRDKFNVVRHKFDVVMLRNEKKSVKRRSLWSLGVE